MPSINEVLESTNCYLTPKQKQLAKSIDCELQCGQSYRALNGIKLRAARSYIRFKLNYNTRLLYQNSVYGYEPLIIIARKDLENWIKRR